MKLILSTVLPKAAYPWEKNINIHINRFTKQNQEMLHMFYSEGTKDLNKEFLIDSDKNTC